MGNKSGRPWVEVTTMGDLLDRRATEIEGEALVFPDARMSFEQYAERADVFARAMLAVGVGPQDKVGILLAGGIDFLPAVFGAMKLGAIAVPINARFKAYELKHVIINSDMRLLLTSAPSGPVDYPALVREALGEQLDGQKPETLSLANAPHLRQIVVWGEEPGPSFVSRKEFERAAKSVPPDRVETLQERVCVRDIALIMYTSGTTASPKGALLTHESLVRQGYTLGGRRLLLTPDDRLWTSMPLFHIGGIAYHMAAMCMGSAYVHPGIYTPDVALDQLADESVTVALPGFETVWLPVLEHPRFEQADLSALRLVMNVGVPERLRAMQEAIPHAVQISSFGLTEGTSHISIGHPDDDLQSRVTTGGRIMPGMEVKIVDPQTGDPREFGEMGEICFRGYSRFEGYYNEPDLTRAVIDEEGWYHSGDMGTMDADGFLTFVTRLKDMLKVGGENVAAAETEDYLAQHEAVNIVQVVAAPDARYGEVPAAFVQLNQGVEATEQELIDFCRGRIATYKVPRYVRFVEDWPMSGTKIKKYVLRERISKELAERNITEAPRIESR